MKQYRYLFCIALLCAAATVDAGFVNQTASLAPGFGGDKAAWGDYNNDGYADVIAGGVLWENNAGAGFTQVYSGLGDGVWADYDDDGRLDFFCYSSRILYRNESTSAAASFVSVPMPAFPMNVSRAASWADQDNDGDIDLYVTGFEIWDVDTYSDIILRNEGDGTFSIWDDNLNTRPARGVTSCDFDRDGDQDIFVSNYRLQENWLLRNGWSGIPGAYEGVESEYNADEGGSGSWPGAHTIGSAWGDLDNDGNFDLFVGNFAHPDNEEATSTQPQSQFLRNLGATESYHFEDKRLTAGLGFQESYASPALGDYDNDGDLDLFLTTVYATASYGVQNYCVLYSNNGDWTFTDVTAAEGLNGLQVTYQAAWADFDNDGDLDLVTDGKIFVNDESQTGTNHWLKVKLMGDGTDVNMAAIGSEVRIDLGGGNVLTRQVEGGTGEGNQNDLTLHFGLGSHSGLVDIELSFAGTTETISGVSVDQAVVCSVPDAEISYHLNINKAGTGYGIINHQTGWFDDGTNLSITATTAGSTFAGWTGSGVPVGHENDNPLAVTMDQSRDITANFTLITNTIPYEETFESYTNGFAMVGGTNGWSSASQADALVSSALAAYSEPCGYPVPSADHDKVLEVTGALTNQFNMSSSQLVWVDCMVMPDHGSLTTDTNVLAGVQAAVAFNPDDHPAVWHYDIDTTANRWTEIDSVTVSTGDWVRLTYTFDYQTDDPTNSIRYFQVRVDGTLLTNALAKTANDGTGTGDGSWFAMSSEPDYFSQFSIRADDGTEAVLDDLVVTTDNPLARDVTIASAHGQADPAAGTHTYTYGDTVSLSLIDSATAEEGINQYVYDSWEIVGHAPASGTGTNVVVATLTNNLAITWHWATNNTLTGQGTPVWWLASHGLVESNDVQDVDFDGMLAWEEWVADTDPASSDSVLAITNIVVNGLGTTVYWKGGVQAIQYLEQRTNLVSGALWEPVFTNLPPTSTTANFIDSEATNPTKFYRIRVER